jgi:hypothetical protein
LEDIERVEDLINQELTDSLLGDVDDVLSEYEFAVVSFIVVQTLAES